MGVLAVVLITDLWHDYVVEPGRQGIFLVLAAFLVSFLFIRTSARLIRSPRVPWWPGSVVTDGGVHLHHLVWGICLMLGGGTVGFALAGQSPWFEVTAVVFGVGAGLTFDEFALWIYLKDVYWAREGRQSIDAVAVTAAFMGLVFLGVNPLAVTGDDVLAVLVSFGYSAGVLLVSGTCFAKGRFVHGFATLVLPPLGLWAVVRLAHPDSAWARLRYGRRDPERQALARTRYGPHRRTQRLADRFRAWIGGFPIVADDAPAAPAAVSPVVPDPVGVPAAQRTLDDFHAAAENARRVLHERADAEARRRAEQR